MPPAANQPDREVADAHTARLYPACAILLTIAITVCGAWGFVGTSAAPNPDNPRTGFNSVAPVRVDPNQAEWWELAALPRIGEVTAKKIVEYRRDHAAAPPDKPVFRTAQDLTRVRGIGPKTVERLTPFLSFR